MTQINFSNQELSIEDKYHLVKSFLDEELCAIEIGDAIIHCTLRDDFLSTSASTLKGDITSISDDLENLAVWNLKNTAWQVIKVDSIQSIRKLPTKWEITVEEDPETGELILPLPADLLDIQGWVDGDSLEWIDHRDGSWSVQKANDSETKKI